MSSTKPQPRARKPDAETLQFMAHLERSIQQAQAGMAGRKTTGAVIARRTRGRPPAPAPAPKAR